MDPIALLDQSYEFAHLSKQELEKELTQHTANLNAANCKQVLLIAEFDRRRAWAHEGVRSCAHWLNFQCGIALGAAREKIRVGHALALLPQTREAFEVGSLSYSKARAITRVATPQNESTLLNIARYGTASHVETTVRLYRKEQNRNAAATAHDSRQLNTHWNEDGCLILKACLPPEEGAVVLRAIEAAMETLKTEQKEAKDVSAETSKYYENEVIRERKRRRADALVSMAEALLQNNTTDTHTADRYQVVVHVDEAVLSNATDSSADGKPDSYIENETGLPVDTVRRLSCDCKLVACVEKGGEPMSIGRRSRTIPTAIRRALYIRDGICQFPGCGCNKHLHAHQIVHWANGGETSLENLVEVCHYHHKLLHEGGYTAWRHNGTMLFFDTAGQRVSHIPADTTSNYKLNSAAAESWRWSGDTMDYSIALNSMLIRDG